MKSTAQQIAQRVEYLMQDQTPPEEKFTRFIEFLLDPDSKGSTRARKQRAARFLYNVHSRVDQKAFVFCVYSECYTSLATADVEEGCRLVSAIKNTTLDTENSQMASSLCQKHDNIVSNLLSWGSKASKQRAVPRSVLAPTLKPDDLTQTAREPAKILDDSSSRIQTPPEYLDGLSSMSQKRLAGGGIDDGWSSSAEPHAVSSETFGNSGSNSQMYATPTQGFGNPSSNAQMYQTSTGDFGSLNSEQVHPSHQSDHLKPNILPIYNRTVPWSRLFSTIADLDDEMEAKCDFSETGVISGFIVTSKNGEIARISIPSELTRALVTFALHDVVAPKVSHQGAL